MGDGDAWDDKINGSLFSYIELEERVRIDHPLRAIREIANAALETLSRDFARLYSGMGRPSIAPEKLLRAMLLQAFYSVRSERQLMERIEFDLLFRWAPLGDRQTDDTASQLCRQPAHPQTDRGSLRLDQDRCWTAPDQAARVG